MQVAYRLSLAKYASTGGERVLDSHGEVLHDSHCVGTRAVNWSKTCAILGSNQYIAAPIQGGYGPVNRCGVAVRSPRTVGLDAAIRQFTPHM